MSSAGVTLDFSKAQPLTLDFSKAQPLQGAPPQPPQQQQQAAQQQQQQQDTQPPPQGGVLSDLLGVRSLRDLLPDSPTTIMNRVGRSPGEILGNIKQRLSDAQTGALRSLTTGAQNVETKIRDVTGTHLLDPDIASNEQYLRESAPQQPAQQENYSAGDLMAGQFLGKWIEEGLSAVQIAKNMKSVPVLSKLAQENPHIAKIIGAGLRSGSAQALTTGAMGGDVGDVGNAFLTGGALGAAGEAPTAHADYLTEMAGKYKPDVTNIGGQKFTEVSQAAREKGITTQEQEPGLQAQNQQSYQTLRDQALRERAAQGTAAAVNAMEPTQPKVSVAGAQRLKAKISASTAGPEAPITDASPREIDQNKRFLQKIIDSKKFPQGIKDKAQTQLDRITTQEQAVADWKNNPNNFRTETPIDPKVLMQNSTNFGEFATELNRQAERRTQDMQWHQRQYDNNGRVKLDASGNEVWKPVDISKMSRTEQDANIADGDLAKRDVRGLSTVDVKQGQRLGEMANTAQRLDDITQKIYDLTRERTASIQQQTGQPNLTQEQRTANMQGHIDELEKLAKDKSADLTDMFGRKDGMTDLIAAAKKIAYGDNGAKYSGTLGDYALKTVKSRYSLQGKKSGLGIGMALLAKSIGLTHGVPLLMGEAAAEAAHNRFMHQVATNPEYANKVLTKDRSPVKGIRFTSSSLANLGAQVGAREGVSKQVQSGQSSEQQRDID